MKNEYLVWLEWPEKCFRMDAAAMRHFRSLLPEGSRVVRARSEAAFLRALPSATHAFVWHFREEWYARARRLRVLATPAAGRELVSTKGPAGVTIHFGGFHGPIISETVLGFLLAWTRGFFWKGPLWPRARLAEHCGDLEGTTAVIAGFGRIGRAVAARMEPFGVKCFGITRHGIFEGSKVQEFKGSRVQEFKGSRVQEFKGSRVQGFKGSKVQEFKGSRVQGFKGSKVQEFKGSRDREIKGLGDVCRRADWFILALPSDTGTDDFLDERMIGLLPRKCVVINVGRGNSVDEKALVAALRERRLAGAYLDVFKQEPTALNPKVGPNGRGLAALKSAPPNLVRMPHSSAFSPRYLKECFKELKAEGQLE